MKLDKTVFALHKCIRERYLQYLEGFSLEQCASKSSLCSSGGTND